MKTSLETENNFKLSKIELLPMNDISNSYGNLLEKYKFTGHERDQNTNYDYMHFRYYSSNIGRFLKPDNVTGSPMNPQNWNLYAYVRGNPVNYNDPTGHQGEEPNSKLPQSGGDPNAQVEAKDQIKEEQNANNETEENKPLEGANDQCLEQSQSPEKVNPITGEPGIIVGQNGEVGTIRTKLTNMNIGLFGDNVRKSSEGTKKAHYGIDIISPEGTKVVAAAGGEVVDVGERGKAGLRIQIRADIDCSINIYAHLSSIDVKQGDRVETGQTIGKSGTTGNARGLPKDQQHLHFAVINFNGQRVDPFIWLNSK